MIRSFNSSGLSFDGAAVLVTGGTGSFGKAFIHKVLNELRPKRLIIFSRDEQKQYELAQSLEGRPVRFFIGDVRDADRLEMAMRSVDYVVHAAALKQIPAAEYNPFECIKTNVHGAENVVNAALRTGVKRVIALSTDKAANPINLYGASKLASDKIFVAANNLSGASDTRFSVVRYGNVLGSRGSVVPLYEELLRKGAPDLPVTDERMTRFWITLRQGVEFVLSCFTMMHGGEIFVPKIPSLRMTDLATFMAPTLPHRIVGIRPGEKLHEVMVTSDDARSTYEFDDRYIIEPAFAFWNRRRHEENGARPVDGDFYYSSDANEHWLDRDSFKTMLAESRS